MIKIGNIISDAVILRNHIAWDLPAFAVFEKNIQLSFKILISYLLNNLGYLGFDRLIVFFLFLIIFFRDNLLRRLFLLAASGKEYGRTHDYRHKNKIDLSFHCIPS